MDCRMARCYAQSMARLEVAVTSNGDAASAWGTMRRLLFGQYKAWERFGVAPKGFLERMIDTEMSRMDIESDTRPAKGRFQGGKGTGKSGEE